MAIDTASSVAGVVDAHAHYLSPRFIEVLERDGATFGCRVLRTPAGEPLIAFEVGPRLRPVAPALCDLDQRVQRMTQQGVEQQLLSSWMELYCYFLPPEQGARWCRLMNQTLADDLRAYRGQHFSVGMAIVPLQDGRRAADELEFAVRDLGLRGVMIAPNFLERHLDDASLEPLWAAAEALRQPVFVHPYAPQAGFRFREYNLSQSVGNPMDTTLAAGALIFGGVLDRHSELKVVLAHGGGFFPYQVGRFERVHRVSPEARAHGASAPLEYLRRFYYDSVLFHPPAVEYLVSQVGADRVVLGSDYPFPAGDPDPVAAVDGAHLEPLDRARVLGGTYRELFISEPTKNGVPKQGLEP